MSEAIELEQWWADIADELGVQAAYLHVHGMDWRGRTDGNEVVARAVATIARLREELAAAHDEKIRLSALAGDNLMRADSLAADLAALRGRVEEAVAWVRTHGFDPNWTGQHVNDAPNAAKVASSLLAILSPPEGP